MNNTVANGAETMRKKYKKGDLVTIHGEWNRFDGSTNATEQVIYTQRCVVQSWGAKQGTLRDADTGEMILEQVYACSADHIFPGHVVSVEWVRSKIEKTIAYLRATADRWESRNATGWENLVPKLREAASAIESGAFRVEDYSRLMEEI